MLKRGDVLGDLEVVDKTLVQTRVLATGQDQRYDIQLSISGLEVRGGDPVKIEAWKLNAILDGLPLDAGQLACG